MERSALAFNAAGGVLALALLLSLCCVDAQAGDLAEISWGKITLGSEGFTRDDVAVGLSNQVLDAEVKRVHRAITALFGLKTNVMFVDDPRPNYAKPIPNISSQFPELSREYPDGTILVDRKLIERSVIQGLLSGVPNKFFFNCADPGSLRVVTIAAIVAHEVAHLLQYKRHFAGAKRELHADVLAGWAIANRVLYSEGGLDLCDARFSRANAAAMAAELAFELLGDDSAPSRKAIISTLHGSGIDRKSAVLTGIALLGRDIDSAYGAAGAFVGMDSVTSTPGVRPQEIETKLGELLGKRNLEARHPPPALVTHVVVTAPTIHFENCRGRFVQSRSLNITVDDVESPLDGVNGSLIDQTIDLSSIDLTRLDVSKVGDENDFSLVGISRDWWIVRFPKAGASQYRLFGSSDPKLIVEGREIADETAGYLREAVRWCQNRI